MLESERLFQVESDGRPSNARRIVFAVIIAFVAVILSLSISAIVLSTKALHDKKVENNNTDKLENCYYTSNSNNYTVPTGSPYAIVSTLIKGGTVWTGTGQTLANHDILIVNGKIAAIGPSPLPNIPASTATYEANGAFITPGIVDMHSHAGVYGLPTDAHATQDGNEATNPTTPQVRTIDAIDPNDPAIGLILSGGVTTSLILPGSANLIGGEAYPVKMKGGSVANMTISGAPRYFKMAAGENPKGVYGRRTQLPSTRMGNAWGFRRIFADASALKAQQDQWDCVQKTGTAQQAPRPYSAQLEPLVAILRGEALVNVHCYEVQDFEAILRVADEFNFKIAAFHHALEAYHIPYVFAPRNITIATFSDHWGFKMEAYDASVNNPSILNNNGVKVALKSDHPVLFAKFLMYEAAKANHYGLGIESALLAVTAVPAAAMGLSNRIGTLEVGKDGDVVIWDRHPLVVGARPTRVFIEGVPFFSNPLPANTSPSVTPPSNYTASLTTSANACSAPTASYYITGGATGSMYTMTDDSLISNPIVIVTNGSVSCVGDVTACPIPTSGYTQYSLEGGWIIPGIISSDSTVGMNEIDQEVLSGDGYAPLDNSASIFAADGIRLEGKKVWAAWAGGVTVQVAKPEGTTLITGTSAAFYTHGVIASDALLSEKLALHLTIGNNAKLSSPTSSVSGQFALLRSIFKASNASADPKDPVFMALTGVIPIIVNVDQADEIGSLLRLIRDYNLTNVSILGGAEAALIAQQIKAAGVSVILNPVFSFPATFETQRSTDADPSVLVAAGVNLAIAEYDAGNTRNLRWNAGYAMTKGLTYPQALATVTRNVANIFNLPSGTGTITVGTKANFVMYDGDPLATGSHVVTVALGDFVECNPKQL